MNENERYEKAKKRAELKLGFYVHGVIFAAVNFLLFIVNAASGSDKWWFVWPLFGWGIGLLVHGVFVYFNASGEALKDEMIRKELAKDE